MEPAGRENFPADHVQLDFTGSGGLAEAGIRGVAQTAGTAGCAHADGYPGYYSLPEQTRVVGCCAHARRKFDEAVNSLPKQEQADGTALEGQRYCTPCLRWRRSLPV